MSAETAHEGRIVQIFRSKGGSINHTVARVVAGDAMLLNELHGVHSSVSLECNLVQS
jgi:hypothetical protein